MGKKKGRRQSDPSRDECESTDEETVGLELEVQSSCPHTGVIVLMFRATYILLIVVILALGYIRSLAPKIPSYYIFVGPPGIYFFRTLVYSFLGPPGIYFSRTLVYSF